MAYRELDNSTGLMPFKCLTPISEVFYWGRAVVQSAEESYHDGWNKNIVKVSVIIFYMSVPILQTNPKTLTI